MFADSCDERSWSWDGVVFEQWAWAQAGDSNDRSCVLRVEADGEVLLLTGDISRAAEHAWLARQADPRVDWLLAPHHGSRSSSGVAFVLRTRPRHVLVARLAQRLRPSHGEVMERYARVAAQVHDTARDGALTLAAHAGSVIRRTSGGKNENRGGRRKRVAVLEWRHFFRGYATVWNWFAGGWMMLPIILSSIAATAIVAERLWTLRKSRVAPPELLGQVWKQIKGKQLSAQKLRTCAPTRRWRDPRRRSGQLQARSRDHEGVHRGGCFRCHPRAGALPQRPRHHRRDAPLLGLLGTVFGMIQIFGAFMDNGMANSPMLAAGISKALITTAAGLLVAIPAVFFHRYLLRRVDELVIAMEQEAIKLVEVVQGDREVDYVEEGKA